ncbi:hypothetical protein [Streptomyces sp. NPDC048332]
MWFPIFCVAAACFALAGLCSVAPDEVPVITGSVALICTLAAFGLAILH